MRLLINPINAVVLAVLAVVIGVLSFGKFSPNEMIGFVLAIPFVAAFAMAWVIVISARAKRAFANQNQLYTGPPTSRRPVTLPNVAQFNTPGQIIMVGSIPGVTLDAYQTTFGGCTVQFAGSFLATVIGRSANSPLVTAQVNPGDKLYYSGGTLDATTNVLYGGVLDKNIAGPFFGNLDPTQAAILAGVTNTQAGVVIDGIS